MSGLTRITYWLGWLFLVLSVIARVATYTALSQQMVYLGLLPRNFLQLSFLFFIVATATAVVSRKAP